MFEAIKNISTAAIAKIQACTPGSFEHGKAIADALIEAQNSNMWTDEMQQKFAVLTERFTKLVTGQRVVVYGSVSATVVSVARNGVWIMRRCTEAEHMMTGQEYRKERVAMGSVSIQSKQGNYQ